MDGIKGWETLVGAMNAAGCPPETIRRFEARGFEELSIVPTRYGGYVVIQRGAPGDVNQMLAAFTSLDHAALWLRDAVQAISRKQNDDWKPA